MVETNNFQGGNFSPPAQQYVPPVKLYPAEYFEKKAEKKILRRRANWMGAELLFVQAFGTVAALIAMILLTIMGWDNGKGGVYADALEYIFYSPLGLLLPAMIITWGSKQKVTDLIPFKKVEFSSALGLFLFGFFALAIGGMLSDIVMIFFPTSVNILEASMSADPTNCGEWIALILYSAAIPALVEEFVFRGVMLNSLRRYGDVFAIWFSAIMFALVHGNILQIAVALPAGVFFGYMTVLSNNIWVAVALHFVNNTIASFSGEIFDVLTPVFTNIFGNISTDFLNVLINGTFYAVYILLGLIGLVIIKIKSKKDTAFGSKSDGTVTCLTKGEKVRGLYLAPTVIISIIFYVAQSGILLIPQIAEFLV